MLAEASKLHFARELRTNTQRLAAVLTDQPLLGVRSWITLKPKSSKEGDLETICLWFNSTLGLLMRLAHANQPYPGRSLITHSAIPSLKALGIIYITTKLSKMFPHPRLRNGVRLPSKNLGVLYRGMLDFKNTLHGILHIADLQHAYTTPRGHS